MSKDAGKTTIDDEKPEPGPEEDAELASILKMKPEEIAKEHKKMMAGVDEGKAPTAGSMNDAKWKERGAYRKAFEDHVGKFLSGDLKDGAGEVVQHREVALAHAHLAGRKAVQALKKTGLKMTVYSD